MAAPAVKLMRAVQYDSYGGGAAGLKHVEIPIPSPKKDEVLLKLEASTINPIDWKLQTGLLRPILPRKFPFVPVADVAGEVVEVGPGVSSLKVGDKVVTTFGVQRSGGLAEYAVAPSKLSVTIPPLISAAEAAGLPIAGITALQCLQAAGIRFDGSGKPANVLVTAASGGVGLYAVQLAKLGNFHVTATAGARNLDLVKSLGADELLDYKTPAGAALQSPSGKKYDAVIHCTTGIPWSTFEPNLAKNGKVLDITPNVATFLNVAIQKITFSKKHHVPFIMASKREDLEFLVGLVKEGKLKTIIDSKHPLSQVEAAWVKSIDGHATGKIVVENQY